MLLQTRSITFGDFSLDQTARQLRRDDTILPVTGKAFDLLVYMAANPGRPLLKKELLDAIWPDSFVEEANLTQNVFVLRKAMGQSGSQIIQTLPGRGYQFLATVVEVPIPERPVPELPGPPSASFHPASPPSPHLAPFEATATRIVYKEETEEHIPVWRSPVAATLAVVALVLLGVAGWLGWQRWEDRVGGPPVQVVLADQDGSTGDPMLDRTLNSILRFQLAQSPFVTVVPAATVRQKLVEMKQKADGVLTAAIAQDLCERTSSQAILRGTVARAGALYVLTAEATSCVDGSTLGTAREQVARVEDLPTAVDKLGASLRHSLGESRRTISRYNQPLAAVDTVSIEALKSYSQALYVAQSGRFQEAIGLSKQAVALDPNFAAAYLSLSLFSANALDPEASRQYLRKAYDLRADTTEPIRLFIAAKYDTDITEDLYQSLRDYQAWVQLYPRSAQAWSGMTQVYRELGDNQNALRTSRHMTELAPNNVVVYQALADAQMKTGDFSAAKATCMLALNRGFDGENIRFLLLRLGHLLGDESLITQQQDWSNEHPDAAILMVNEAEYALQNGDFDHADILLHKIDAAFRRQGSPQAAISLLESAAAHLFALGEEQRGRTLLQATPIDAESYDDLLALVEAGKQDQALKLLADQLSTHPQATLWNLRYAPLLRGKSALMRGNAQEAIHALDSTRQLDGTSLDGFYLRGQALLAAGHYPEAEAEFRALLSHPEIEPTSSEIPLARLGLARVLLAEGKREASVGAYQQFIGQWSSNGASSVLLSRARLELAQIPGVVGSASPGPPR